MATSRIKYYDRSDYSGPQHWKISESVCGDYMYQYKPARKEKEIKSVENRYYIKRKGKLYNVYKGRDLHGTFSYLEDAQELVCRLNIALDGK